MPNYIDQKVVQMEFDNSRFEKGVEQSLKTLEALKKGLELDKSANSLSNLEKIANEVDFSGLTKNIDSIADHFTVIGRFIDRHIDAMVDKAVSGTKRFISSITTEQIGKGMNKYEQYNKSVQMIQSALPDETMDNIEKILGRLNQYTDETSYDFATMASTIGKFTSKGIGLNDAELAMEGIANWSAAAGTDIAQANIAMYNLAQALGVGAVKAQDWRSIVNANMDTKEFMEAAIETAKALGVLGDAGKGAGIMIEQTSKGIKQTIVDSNSFYSTLSKGWFTNDVLLSVLKEYADTETYLGAKGKQAAKEAITFTQAIDAVKDAVSTGWMNSFKFLFGNLDEATELFTFVSDSLIEFLDIFTVARNTVLEGWHGGGINDETSGYAMAIDALTTSWENFMIVVEHVRDLVKEVFPPVTAENLKGMTENIRNFTKDINEFLTGHTEEKVIRTKIKTDGIEEWTDFIRLGSEGEDVKRLQKRLMDLGFDLGKTGADGIFGPKTQEALMDFQAKLGLVQDGVYKIEERDGLAKALFPNGVTKFKETTETTVTLSSALENIQKVIRGVFSIVSIGGQVVGFVINLVKTGLYILAPLGSAILTVLGVIGDCFTTLDQGLKILDPFNTAIAILQNFIGNQLADFFDGLGNAVSFFLGAVGEAPSFLGVLIALFETIEQTKFGQYIKGIWDVVSSVFGLASGSISGFLKDIQGAIKIVNNAFDMMFQAPEGRFNSFWSVWKHFEKVFLISSNKITGTIGGFMYHARIGLQQVIPKIKEFGANAKAFLGKAFTTTLTVAGVAIGAIVSGAIALGKAIWNTGKAVVNFVKTNETLQSIFANIRSVGERVIGFFGDLGKAITSGFGIAKEKKIKGFGDILARVFYGMRNSKNTVIQQLGTGLRNFITGLGFVINKVKEFGATAGKWLGKAFSTVLKVGALAVTALVAGIIWLGKTLWNAGKAVVTFVKNNKILEDIFNRIGSAAKSVWGFISEFGKSIGSVFTNKSSKKILNFGEIWKKVSRNFRLSKNKHLQALGQFMRDLSRWFKKAGETVKEFGGKVKDWLGGKFTAAITWITENVPKAWDAIKNFFVNAYNNVKGSNVIQNAFQSIKDKISNIFPGIKQALSDIGGAIRDFFFGKGSNAEPKTLKERFEGIKDFFGNIGGKIKDKFQEIYNNSEILQKAWEIIEPFVSGIKELATIFGGSIWNFFTTDTSDAESPDEALKKRLEAFQPLIDKVKEIKDQIEDHLKGIAGIVKNKLKEIYDNSQILQDIYAFIEPIITAIQGLWNAFKTSVINFFTLDTSDVEGSEWDKLKARFGEFSTFADEIVKVKDKLVGAWNGLTGKNGEFNGDGGGKSVFDALTGFFGKFKDKLPSLIGPAIAAGGAYMLVKGIGLVNNLSGGLSDFAKAYAAKKGVKIKEDTLGDTVLKIAGAVTLVTVALWLMQSIDTVKIEPVLERFAGVIVTLLGAFGVKGLIQKKLQEAGVIFGGGGKTTLEKITTAIRDMGIGLAASAAGVLLLVEAYKQMNENLKGVWEHDASGNRTGVSWASLFEKGGAFGAIIALLYAVYRFEKSLLQSGFSYKGDIKNGIGAGTGAALAIMGAAEAVKMLVDAYVKMDKALEGFSLSGYANDENNKWTQKVGAFFAIAALLALLAKVEEKISANLGPKQLGGGIGNSLAVMALAYSVQMLVDAYSKMSDAIKEAPTTGNKWGAFGAIVAFLGEIAGSKAIMDLMTAKIGGGWSILGGGASQSAVIYVLADAVQKIVAAYSEIAVATKDVSAYNLSALGVSISAIIGAIGGIVAALSQIDVFKGLGADVIIGGFFSAVAVGITAIGEALNAVAGDANGPIFSMGSVLEDFNGMVENVNVNKIREAKTALEEIATFLGGDAITITYSAGSGFDQVLTDVGGALNHFNTNVKHLDPSDVENSKTYIRKSKELIEDTAELEDRGLVGRAAYALERMSGALGLYYRTISELTFDKEGPTKEQIRAAFTGLAGAIPDDGTLKTIADCAGEGTGSELNLVAEGIGNIGTAIGKYGDEIGTLNPFKVMVANKVISAFTNLKSYLKGEKVLDFLTFFAGRDGEMAQFEIDIVNVGSAIKTYSKSIKKVSLTDVETANKIINGIASIKLPKNSFFSFITGTMTLGQFSANMSNVGKGVRLFANALKGEGEDVGSISDFKTDIDYALEVLAAIVDAQKKVTSTDPNAFYFVGDAISHLFNVLSGLGEDINGGNGIEDSIASAAENGALALEGIVYDRLESIKTTINTAFTTIKTYIEYYKMVYTSQTVLAMNSISSAIDSKKSKVLNSAASVLTNLVKLGRLYQNDFINIGYQLDYGLAQGIRDRAYHPQGAFARVVRQAYEAGMAAAQIRSPSRVTAWMGEMMDQGLANGLMAYSSRVDNASSDVVQSAIDTAEMGLNTLASIIASDVDTTPVIRPVLDMSDVESGASMLGGMFGNQSIGVRSAGMAYRVASIDNARIYDTGKNDVSPSNLGATIDNLNAKIDELGQRISTMQVVMDNGALVGQMSAGMDHALGVRRMRARRGGV